MEQNFFCPDCEKPSLEVKKNDGKSAVILKCVLCEGIFSPNSAGGFNRINWDLETTCMTCNMGVLKEREDGLRQCVKCKSCFDKNGKVIDEAPRTPSESKKIATELKKFKLSGQDGYLTPVPSPS